ncbi:Uncharacterised protein [uncultured archaeon]|nr:Uncharacterised protein [uncultured archaeon]
MRAWLVLLLFVPFASALVIENAGVGEHPVLYGDLIVYERAGSIYLYDLTEKTESELAKGSNPSLFGYTVAFEAKETDVDLNNDSDKDDTIIQYGNVRNKKFFSTNAAGHNPNVYSDFIVFSTKESELGVDFSNDGDLDDDIVRMYDIDTKEVSNTKTVGDFPAVNKRALIFVTDEKQLGTDLNADGDKLDAILRVYDKENHQVANTKIVASRPVLVAESNDAVFSSEGKLVVFDAVAQQGQLTGIEAINPSIFGDVAVFEHGDNLYGYSLASKRTAKLNVLGSQPSIFENAVAFVSSEKDLGDLNNNGKTDEMIVRYAKAEDLDGDGFLDFVDNCPAVVNVDQVDSNNNGVGDACDKEKSEKKEQKKEEIKVEDKTESNESRNETSQSSEKGVSWYWYLLVVLLLPFAYFVCKFGYRYYKKRQKSFGF